MWHFVTAATYQLDADTSPFLAQHIVKEEESNGLWSDVLTRRTGGSKLATTTIVI